MTWEPGDFEYSAPVSEPDEMANPLSESADIEDEIDAIEEELGPADEAEEADGVGDAETETEEPEEPEAQA